MLSIPLCTTNRINMPATAEAVLAEGSAVGGGVGLSLERCFCVFGRWGPRRPEGKHSSLSTNYHTHVTNGNRTSSRWPGPFWRTPSS